jgi:DNA-binding response OmpR family regulator
MAARRAKIAFIDDSITVRQILSQVLTEAGYDAIECTSWEELQSAAEKGLDLALVDVQMPKHSGPPMVVVLKKKHPGLKVVFYSNVRGRVLRELAEHAGADGFIRKAWDTDELVAAVAKFLEPSAAS